MNSISESDAIDRWKQGDPEGLAALVRLYELRALRAAYLILQDRMDAEDAVQNAFLRAWKYRHRFDPRRPFWPWLLQLIVREAYRIARRDRPFNMDHEFNEERENQKGRREDPLPTLEDWVERSERHRRLRQAIANLSPAQRIAVMLRYYQELNEKEIAEIMGCSIGAVKHYLYEARLRLRAVLDEREG